MLPTLGGWLLRVNSCGVLFALTARLLLLAAPRSLRLPPAGGV